MHRKSRALSLLAFSTIIWVCGPAVAAADPVDTYIRQVMQSEHIPGLVLVVLKDSKVVKQQAYGVANIEFDSPTTIDSIYPLASVTKLFTSTAVFLLVQEGKIRLTDKVTDLLAGLPQGWKDVTVLNCLSHTSGIPDLAVNAYVSAYGGIVAANEEEALKKLSALPLVYKPGEKSIYNQTEFLLLKMIVERVSGMPIEEFLEKRMFGPLGMRSAVYGDVLDIIPNMVSVYTRFLPTADRTNLMAEPNGDHIVSKDGQWHYFQLVFPQYEHGGVGLNMSGRDLAKFDAALSQTRLLNADVLNQMWAPFRLNNGENGGFAGGWETDVLNNGHRVVFHIGAGQAAYFHVVDDHVSVILLTNAHVIANLTGIVLQTLQFYLPGLKH